MWRLIFPLLVALLFTIGCNKGTTNEQQQANQALPKASIDPATAAAVSGSVTFTGEPPAPQKLDMSMDPACGTRDAYYTAVEVKNGRLANTFVYVKSGLPEARWDPPGDEAVLDQNGCRYTPHVLGIMTGQKLKILNSDSTTHNVHPMPQTKGNREWNQSQGPHAEPILKTSFTAQEIMIPVKCNQHPWMKMYLNVVAHPFFAVTGPDGKFEIRGLPPGTYTLAAVHEKLGEQTVEISVGPKEEKETEFSYSSASGR